MLTIFLTFLRLGCTSFGGPIAHLAYFKDEFVDRRQWLSAAEYANIVALCQFIPGPASSQVGAAIGYKRGGYAGAFLAWLAFTLPSAILLYLTAISVFQFQHPAVFDALYGLKLVAIAVVGHAVWGMQKQLCHDWKTRVIALLSAATLLFNSGVMGIVSVIVIAAITGGFWINYTDADKTNVSVKFELPRRSAVLLILFFALLLAGPWLATVSANSMVNVFDILYRSGALVFGGGHVVLPLLHSELVATGMISEQQFLIGYGAAQAVPGPLFTFAAYLGSVLANVPIWQGALVATLAIFLPGMILLFAVLPIWQALSQFTLAKRILAGVNASVVGLLLAVLIDPLVIRTINSVIDIAIVFIATIGLIRFKLHPLQVILLCVTSYTGLHWLSF